jgi:hypothetical protein
MQEETRAEKTNAVKESHAEWVQPGFEPAPSEVTGAEFTTGPLVQPAETTQESFLSNWHWPLQLSIQHVCINPHYECSTSAYSTLSKIPFSGRQQFDSPPLMPGPFPTPLWLDWFLWPVMVGKFSVGPNYGDGEGGAVAGSFCGALRAGIGRAWVCFRGLSAVFRMKWGTH